MASSSMLFVALASVMIAPAACRMCNTGTRTTYSGDCSGWTDTNLISSSTCTLLG
eukprot:CAMPEP_0178412142 /NCGR_PEP_ID=MMETSP0689_2-20121128/21858_1 /TAXON_ID=160604 /ORGANISM="Amphidinium massartii, Strain CS-259" /LENGTH=54 /DNA_ID=CAMNT_0020033371 /DNA_START=20 /DNA_END=180 /DNA_ORIENTATION=-